MDTVLVLLFFLNIFSWNSLTDAEDTAVSGSVWRMDVDRMLTTICSTYLMEQLEGFHTCSSLGK
jgi:hypothetical protein